ncbi:MAG: FAD-dependent oxidoreductase [Pseudomonadota bacterium]
MTDARFAPLFEPLAIGPVTARNRFYQVPHCCGLGHLRPKMHAAMRGVKAEGGWAVVSTEECEIHPSSDLSPYAEQRLWDRRDMPALKLMTDAVHAHGSLAAIELAHNGLHAPNLYSRIPAIAPTHLPLSSVHPRQARRASKRDLAELRHWHRRAALNARDAGFDIIYVYAGHGMTLPMQMLDKQFNQRGDEYGGSFENRLRLTRELLEDTKDAVGDRCAVAFRFAVDELRGEAGLRWSEEGRDAVEALAELPDLWDVNVSDWANDSATSRFEASEGYQQPYTRFVKSLTNKPVVGVGRFTSPDTMAALIARGELDLIGAARPSIADPFLPEKIRTDRTDQIRECIGCNVCVASDNLGIPIRCTQNPSIAEEWRRGWHPENIDPLAEPQSVLVIGSGPAGLECALQLAERGCTVMVAEADKDFGGRVRREASLPGLGAWKRVADYRLHRLRSHPNVTLFSDSRMDVASVREVDADAVFVATGASWREDGVGRSCREAIRGLDAQNTVGPDALMAGARPQPGAVVVYDDEQCYIGAVLAESLAANHPVTFVTPGSVVSAWTENTLEQERVQRRLVACGVSILCGHTLEAIDGAEAVIDGVYGQGSQRIACKTLIPVTERIPRDELFEEIVAADLDCVVRVIGDAYCPALIADAVYEGHKAARDHGRDPADVERELFRREIPSLESVD